MDHNIFFRRLLKPETSLSGTATPLLSPDTARATDILARTIWGEARGEPLAGKEAVANVVINRLRHAQKRGGFWWGHTIVDICTKPYQFSCWNENDPNYKKLIAVGSDDAQFAVCLRIARRAVVGTLPDNTGGADHYHADTIMPSWARDRAPIAVIGNHIFYKLEG